MKHAITKSALCAIALAPALAWLGTPLLGGFAGPAQAQLSGGQTVLLENHKISGKDGSVLTFPRIEFSGTNITRDEVTKLFTAETPEADIRAIITKLKAAKISIPEVLLTAKDAKGSLKGFQVSDLDKGRVGKASLDGGTVDAQTEDKLPVNVKLGPMVLEDADFSAFLSMAKGGDIMEALTVNGPLHLGRASVGAIAASFPDKETPASAPGGNIVKLGLASMELLNTYKPGAKLPERTTAAVKNFTLELPKGSKAAASLAEFGYDKIDAGITLAGTFDAATKVVVIDDYTFSGMGMGALDMKMKLGNYDYDAMQAAQLAAYKGAGTPKEKAARQQALMMPLLLALDFSSFEIGFKNSGVFEKAVAFLAKQDKKKPADLKAEWSATASMMLPALLSGDPVGLKLAEAAAKFITDPKSIRIAAKSKGAPIKFSDLAQVKSPQDILPKLDVTITANQ